ncbi:MAG: chemoreceptor glutamine deamidase CheD [Gammaproteobacteria bacterium]|nr:chemoreceptor glutamine deamidase CheD [Gammaproteobacteria bacterium]
MNFIKLLPGDYYVTHKNETIMTILGSCVSACIYDPIKNVGGMNHFMLPDGEGASLINEGARYGSFAMENTINEIIKVGGVKSNLLVKVFGGARIIEGNGSVGMRNIKFVENYLKLEKIKLISSCVGDIYPLKVKFYPVTGKVLVKKLESLQKSSVSQREQVYSKQLKSKNIEGDIELF